MQFNIPRRVSLSLGVALVLVAASSGASAVTLTNPGPNKGLSGTYINDLNYGTSYGTIWAGAVKVNDGSSTFYAYCIDPKTTVNWGLANAYTAASLSSFLNTPLNNTSPASTAYQQQMNSSYYSGLGYQAQNTTQVQNNLTELFAYAYADSLTNQTKAAAFQYAVWEIMGESSYKRTDGAMRERGTSSSSYDSLDSQIDAYLNALNNNTWSAIGLNTSTSYKYTVYYDPAKHTTQNFIKVDEIPGGDGGGDVPEPASLALFGVALAGAGWARRRAAARA